MIAEYSQEKRAANDIMFNLAGGRGLVTFVWEPTRWRETLFDRQVESRALEALADPEALDTTGRLILRRIAAIDQIED